MFKLIRLEFQKNNLTKYYIGTFFITILLLSLTYLFAYIPRLEGDSSLETAIIEALAPIFSSYGNIISLVLIISMICFSIYSSLVFSEFVLNDYIGKKFYLSLAYPIKKRTLYFAKIVTSIIVILSSTLLCNIGVFAIFYLTELRFQVVTDDIITSIIICDAMKLSLIFSILSLAIGLISLRVGFIKKSIQFSLTTSFVLSILTSNFLGISLLSNINLVNNVMMLTLITLAIAITFSFNYANVINEMEAE